MNALLDWMKSEHPEFWAFLQTSEGQDFLESWASMTDAQRDAVINMLRRALRNCGRKYLAVDKRLDE